MTKSIYRRRPEGGVRKFGQRGTMAAACLSFASYGVISGALGPNLPDLAAHTGSSLAVIGSVLTALYIGAILALLISGPAFDRLGQYPVLMTGAALLGLGIIGLTLGRSLPVVWACAFITGLGHGAMDLSGNLLIAEVFANRRAAAVNLLNVFFGLGAVVGPLAASLTLTLWQTAVPALWLGGGLMLLQLFVIPRTAQVPRPALGGLHPAGEAHSLRALLSSPIFWMLAGLTLTYVGVENGLSSWTATYLARTTAASISAGALAAAGFWLALSAGRMAAAVAGTRVPSKKLLAASLAGALAASLLLLVTVGNAPLTVAAILLAGLFYGPIFPIAFSETTATFRRMAGTAGSLVAAMGSTGAALLPWLQGVLFETAGARASMGLIAAGAMVMLALFGGYLAVARRAAAEPAIS